MAPKRGRQQNPPAPDAGDVYRMPDGSEATAGQLNELRWHSGFGLEELLDSLQLDLHVSLEALPAHSRAVVLQSRKTGKSFFSLWRANRRARMYRDQILRFAFPTKEQGKTIIIPLLEELQNLPGAECPPELRWKNREAQEGCWWLPHTNARLYLAGSDTSDQIDRLRGPKSHETYLDEFTFFHCDLKRLINGVLSPQLISTRGKLFMGGTPPETMDHDSVEYIEHARKVRRLYVKTIFDCPRYSADDIRLICEGANMHATPEEIDAILAGRLEGTPEWEREFKCRMISDAGLRVTPEFRADVHVVDECSQPLYCDRYVFIDPGHAADFFAAVFCVVDYASQKVIVLREYVTRREPTDKIWRALVDIERELGWVDEEGAEKLKGQELLLRYMDPSNLQQMTDLRDDHGYVVKSADKSPGKGKLVTELCNRLNANDVVILAVCEELVDQLENGLWSDKKKADFRRTPKLGHLDLLDALATGLRKVKWHHNPAPAGLYLPSVIDSQVADPRRRSKAGLSQTARALNRTFGIRRRSSLG